MFACPNWYSCEEGVNHCFCKLNKNETTIASDVKFKINFPRQILLYHSTLDVQLCSKQYIWKQLFRLCYSQPPRNKTLRILILGSFSIVLATTTATRTSPNEKWVSKRMAVHVRYKSLYISLPFSARQQREMTKSYAFWTAFCTAMGPSLV